MRTDRRYTLRNFGGFSAQSIADRLQDAKAEFIVTCDGAYRGAKDIPLKSVIDDALIACPFVKRVIVCTRTRMPVSMIKGRDVWWEDEIKSRDTRQPGLPGRSNGCRRYVVYSLHIRFHRKAKGVVHTIGGYMVWTAFTFQNVFQYQQGQIHFVRLTSVGLPATVTLCMVHFYLVQPRLCLKVYQPGPMPVGFGIL